MREWCVLGRSWAVESEAARADNEDGCRIREACPGGRGIVPARRCPQAGFGNRYLPSLSLPIATVSLGQRACCVHACDTIQENTMSFLDLCGTMYGRTFYSKILSGVVRLASDLSIMLASCSKNGLMAGRDVRTTSCSSTTMLISVDRVKDAANGDSTTPSALWPTRIRHGGRPRRFVRCRCACPRRPSPPLTFAGYHAALRTLLASTMIPTRLASQVLAHRRRAPSTPIALLTPLGALPSSSACYRRRTLCPLCTRTPGAQNPAPQTHGDRHRPQ